MNDDSEKLVPPPGCPDDKAQPESPRYRDERPPYRRGDIAARQRRRVRR